MTTAHVNPGSRRDQARRLFSVLFPLAVVVSIVHYSDNYFNYHDYPRSKTLPNPSALVVGSAWFVFTAIGVAGFLLFRREASNRALLLLAAYSGSGLVGIGHYLVPGATSMPWWRQAHVVLDIGCGVAIFVVALWAALDRAPDRILKKVVRE
jgi:hypothetical protein